MPVTKTAKRALRSSQRKQGVNKLIDINLDRAVRTAKKSKASADVRKAISLADRAAKKHLIHKNKASRIKGIMSKLLGAKAGKPTASSTKKTKATKKAKK